MIRQRMPLPPGCARCPSTRQIHCAKADECARGTEPHSKTRQVNDFSTEPRGVNGCGWFVAITYADEIKPAPKVHDAPGWLR